MKKLLNIDDICEITRLSKPTIYLYVLEKRIPFIKLGSRTLFDPDDIEKWLNNKKQGANK